MKDHSVMNGQSNGFSLHYCIRIFINSLKMNGAAYKLTYVMVTHLRQIKNIFLSILTISEN